MMHTEGEAWVCRSCENEEPRDAQSEAAMATTDGQRDDGTPDVADATQGATETMAAACPADDCDGDRAYYEMLPKPGGSYEARSTRSTVHVRRVRPQVAGVLTAHLATPSLEDTHRLPGERERNSATSTVR
jgi:DNA-directed RNA polymerase subunit M